MDLAKMQAAINIAMIEYGISKLKDCLKAESDPEMSPGQRQVVRYRAVSSLDYVIKLLRGDTLITDEKTATEALALESKLTNADKKISELLAENTQLKEEAHDPETEPVFVCVDCDREFSTKRGLGRHAKACKG